MKQTNYKKILSVFFSTVLFMVIVLFTQTQAVSAEQYWQQEQCTVDLANHTITLTNAKPQNYVVRVYVLGPRGDIFYEKQNDNFKWEGSARDTTHTFSNYKSFFTNIPANTSEIQVIVMYDGGFMQQWGELRENGCKINNYPSAGLQFADYDWWPKLSFYDNCWFQVKEGLPEFDYTFSLTVKDASGQVIGEVPDFWKAAGVGSGSLPIDGARDSNPLLITNQSQITYSIFLHGQKITKVNAGTINNYTCDPNTSPEDPPDEIQQNGGQGGVKATPIYTIGQLCSGEEQGSDAYYKCLTCVGADTCGGNVGCQDLSGNVWTELGCITPTNNGIIVAIMRIFVGIVTAFAVFQAIRGGFMINTDEPEKIKEGKSLFISAIIAMAFGALIPIILNFIGVDVLGLGDLVNL